MSSHDFSVHQQSLLTTSTRSRTFTPVNHAATTVPARVWRNEGDECAPIETLEARDGYDLSPILPYPK